MLAATNYDGLHVLRRAKTIVKLWKDIPYNRGIRRTARELYSTLRLILRADNTMLCFSHLLRSHQQRLERILSYRFGDLLFLFPRAII